MAMARLIVRSGTALRAEGLVFHPIGRHPILRQTFPGPADFDPIGILDDRDLIATGSRHPLLVCIQNSKQRGHHD